MKVPANVMHAGRPPRRRRLGGRGLVLVGVGCLMCSGAGAAVPGMMNGAAAEAAAPAVRQVASVTIPRTMSQGAELVSLSWGEGVGQVGLANPQDGLRRGPEALAVAEDGRLALLDGVNGRVVVLSASGEWVTAFPVPLSEPRFLAVDAAQIVVLDCDCDRQAISIGWNGVKSKAYALPETDDPVTGVFLEGGKPLVEVGHRDMIPLGRGKSTVMREAGRSLGRCGGRVKAGFSRGGPVRVQLTGPNTSAKSVDLRADQPIEYLVSVDPASAATSTDKREGNAVLVGAKLLHADSGRTQSDTGDLVVSRIDPERPGVAASIALELPEFAYSGPPYVVGPDGRIYQPVAEPSGYRILVHSVGEES